MRCSNCGSEVKEPTKFCGECGAKFVPIPDPVQAGEDGLYYCYKHKRETTRVSCGRCDRPICTKCMVMGPAGIRCRECAKNKVKIRPRGVLHDLGAGVTSSPTAQRVWYMAIFFIVVEFIGSIFGGRPRM